MNMLTFTAAFAVLWILQLFLSWRQAKCFLAEVAVLRGSGAVFIGRGKRRGLRTYVALALKDGVVAESRILDGYTVFARPKPCAELAGMHVDQLRAGAATGLHRRSAAAAMHAAALYTQHAGGKRVAATR